MRIKNIANIVGTVLEFYPETRDDDYLLWLEVLRQTQFPEVCDVLSMPVNRFLTIARYTHYPQFETVSRARRKLQAQRPELRATPETQAARAEMERKYREYARADV